MPRNGHRHHAALAGRPRRRDDPIWAWSPPEDGLVHEASLSDLLSRAGTYDRVGDAFCKEGFVACASGLEGMLAGGGSVRALLCLPVLAAGESWSTRCHGAATDAAIQAALDAALADGEGRDALTVVAYLASRGRLTIGLAMTHRVATDLRSYGQPHPAWAIAADAGHAALLLPGGGAHRLVGRDGHPAVVRAAEATESLWGADGARPQTEPLPPAFAALLRGMGERTLHPVRSPAAQPARRFSATEILRFAMLRDAPTMPGGRFLGIESAPVAPWPHQAAVARRIVEGFPRSWLLADEVGLGKTIEAGLALRALILSGTCARALVAAPASLCGQWQREMRLRFSMEFEVADPTARDRLYEPDRLIVSRSLLASTDPGRASALEAAAPWDVAVADEAHGARRGTNLARAMEDAVRPRCSSLLLATATPMQLRPRDAFDLNRWTRRGGAFDGDDVLSEAYYQLLEEFPEGSSSPARPTPEQYALLASAMREQRETDPAEWSRAWSNATCFASEAARRDILAFVEGDADDVQPRAFKALRHLAYSVAPLGRTMLRHGRAILRLYEGLGMGSGMRLPTRVVHARALAFDGRERDFNALLDAYVTGLSSRLSGAGRKAARGAAFYASFVRLRAASSETAAMRTFRRRLAKVESCLASAAVREAAKSGISATGEAVLGDDDVCIAADEAALKDRTIPDLAWEAERLRGLLVALDARAGATTSKASALLEALDGARGRGAVVFTRFRDTLDEIVAVVEEHAPDLRFGTYSGAGGAVYDRAQRRLVPRDREEVTAAIQAGLIDLLVCTDAAAEGLNLQRAGLLVNYDLPWNPTKVEQRIGRVDRIGQVHDVVEVVNLIYQGSAEERVYARLLERLDAIGTIVGSQQISLIPLSEGDFLTLASSDVAEARKAALVERAQAAAVAAARRVQARETPARHLLWSYFNEDARCHGRRMPARLGDLWRAIATSPTLAALGFEARPDGNLALPDDAVARGRPYMLTIDRGLHEIGMSPDGVRTAFATWGDPVVEAVFRLFGERPLPAFARRLEARVRVGARDVPVVGYAVATPHGRTLLTSVDDIEACPFDPDGAVTDDDAEALMPTLRALAEAEYAEAVAAPRAERASRRAARARRRLVRGVCLALLDQCPGTAAFEAEASVIEAKVLAMREGTATFVARLDPAVAKLMPGTFEPVADGSPGRYKVTTDALTLRSAMALAREAREDIRKGESATMRDVFMRILGEARAGVPDAGRDPGFGPVKEPPAAYAEPTAPEPVHPSGPHGGGATPGPEVGGDDLISTVDVVEAVPSSDASPAAVIETVAVEATTPVEPDASVAVETDGGPDAEPLPVPAGLPAETRATFVSAAADILVFTLSHGDSRGHIGIAYPDGASASAALEAVFSVDETLGDVIRACAPSRIVRTGPVPDAASVERSRDVRPCAVILECPEGDATGVTQATRILHGLLSRTPATVSPAAVTTPAPAVPADIRKGDGARPVRVPPTLEVGRVEGDGSRVRLGGAGGSLEIDVADVPELIRRLSGLVAAPAHQPAAGTPPSASRRAQPTPRSGRPTPAHIATRQDKVVLARLYAAYPNGLGASEIEAQTRAAGLPAGSGQAALARLGRRGWVRGVDGAWSLIPDVRRRG